MPRFVLPLTIKFRRQELCTSDSHFRAPGKESAFAKAGAGEQAGSPWGRYV